MTIKDALQATIKTLQTIPVTGAENMEKMLGCIRLLDTIVNNTPEKEKETQDG